MKRVALLVGINQYLDPGILPLQCAENDALALKTLLTERCDFQVTCLTNEQATREGIVDAWEALCGGLQTDDAILLYFAGHGHDLQDDQHALMPYDIRLKDIDDDDVADMIRVRRLERKSRPCGASRILLYDACRTPLRVGARNSHARLPSAGARDIVGMVKSAGLSPLAALWACSSEEQAYEIPQLKRSVFSLAFERVVMDHLQKGLELSLPGRVLGQIQETTRSLLREHGVAGAQNPVLHANRERIIIINRPKSQVGSVWPTPIEEPKSGDTFAHGRFRLVESLGTGPTGKVWLAEDEHRSADAARADVALKFLDPSLVPHGSTGDLLQKEVRKAKCLIHSGIVQVDSWHHHQGEPLFYAMEFVPGTDMHQALAEHPAGRFSSSELESFLDQLASALDFAHNQNIPHGNLKLSNIFITPERRYKLADFALDVPPSPENPSPVSLGSPLAYMSPQRRRGEPLTFADDIYSIGAILFHLLTGEMPDLDGGQQAPGHEGKRSTSAMDRFSRLTPEERPLRPITWAAAETVKRCLSENIKERPDSVRTLKTWWHSGPPWEDDTREKMPFWRWLKENAVTFLSPKSMIRIVAFSLLLLLVVAAMLGLKGIGDSIADQYPQIASILRSLGIASSPTDPPPPKELFRSTDQEPLRVLAAQLKAHTNEPLTQIHGQLAESTQTALATWEDSSPPPLTLVTQLVSDLNRLIQGPLVWTPTTDEQAELRPETVALLKSKPTGSDALRLNRNLIDEASRPVSRITAPPKPETGQVSTMSVTFTDGPNSPIEARLYLVASARHGEVRTTNAWKGQIYPEARQTFTVPSEGADSAYFEAGPRGTPTGNSWIRHRIPFAPGTTQDVNLPFQRIPLSLVTSEQVPLELMDGWSNRIAVIPTNHFVPNRGPNRAAYPWRVQPPRSHGYSLPLPGDYAVRVAPEHSRTHRLEPIAHAFSLTPATIGDVEVVLHGWGYPRMDSTWVLPVGLEFLPVGGPQPFLVARTETSIAQFEMFVTETGKDPGSMVSISTHGNADVGRTWRNPFNLSDPNLPAVGVSWSNAMAFCEWLTGKERASGRLKPNQSFTLPTDEQWSRFAGTTKYPWGDGFQPTAAQGIYARFSTTQMDWPKSWAAQYLGNQNEEGPPRTVRVLAGATNSLGLFHVGGNAAEWCDSDFRPELNAGQSWILPCPYLEAIERAQGNKVVRGASWFDNDEDLLRTSTRWAERPDTRNDRIGFRVVLIETP